MLLLNEISPNIKNKVIFEKNELKILDFEKIIFKIVEIEEQIKTSKNNTLINPSEEREKIIHLTNLH